MLTREEAVQYCLTFKGAYEDYPFHDANWTVMRVRHNKKSFAYIYEKECNNDAETDNLTSIGVKNKIAENIGIFPSSNIWINVKCDPEWLFIWRQTYNAVVPAYHMNKKYWNSLILNGTIPDKEIKRMIAESYDLVR